MQPTERFSNRVDDYVRYRPSYPADAVDFVVNALGLTDASSPEGRVVAELGAGTGIFSALLLERRVRVHAVEPNEAMRRRSESLLGRHEGFSSIDGTAEATGLPSGSVDAVVAAQAFHWFDPEAAREETRRILRSNGVNAALLWNARRLTGSPFLEGYEALLLAQGTDYARVRHQDVASRQAVEAFFGGPYDTWSTRNEQRVDWDGLRGRAASASYVPSASHPLHDAFFEALRRLFDATAEGGFVRFVYDVDVRFARVA
jgi:SAM-dependent methyltransferase